jgi:hypothetical protein
MSYRQARWIEPTIFELSRPGAIGIDFPEIDEVLQSELKEALG